MHPDLVILDLDGTVDDHRSAVGQALDSWLPALGRAATSELFDAWIAAENRALPGRVGTRDLLRRAELPFDDRHQRPDKRGGIHVPSHRQ